ncbi:MAG: hypothetical protein AAFX53_03865, partial [Bacteroidota bacterium]
MKFLKIHSLLAAGFLLSTLTAMAQDQDDDDSQGSVIQNLTPSKLIAKRQWDIKLFNNLYTQ